MFFLISRILGYHSNSEKQNRQKFSLTQGHLCKAKLDNSLFCIKYGLNFKICMKVKVIVAIIVGSVADRVKAPFLQQPCDHDRVI